jgi:hypothetical protein
MKPEPLPGKPPRHTNAGRRQSAVVAAATLALYATSIVGLRVLCHRWQWNEVFVVPFLGELILFPTLWTSMAYWKGALGRLLGLSLGNCLFHFLYLIPVVYHGQDPWPEEVLWSYVITAAQTVVAGLALLASRLLRAAIARAE